MKLYIGSDKSGKSYKKEVIAYLKELNHEVIDVTVKGDNPDYPDVASKVCKKVLKDKDSKGILICGTGMGMCLAANKIKGIRATLCMNDYCALKSRTSNDANILTLGALTTGIEVIKGIVKIWTSDLKLSETSKIKVEKIMNLEKNNE